MKNKLIVMAFTFFIMIALTPLIFSKLMNAKFNKMLESIKNQGIELKEIKDKSTYLQTDRVFEVIIPGSKLNSSEIEYIKAVIEAKFKNLPVTTADFEGVVKEIKTKDFDNNEINKVIKDKIKFFVTTPNFKVYSYKIYDTSFDLNKFVLSFKNTKGVFVYPSKNSLSIAVVEIKGKEFDVKVKNFKNEYEKKDKELFTSNSFDIEGKIGKSNFELNKFASKSVSIFSVSKLDNITNISFEKLNFSNIFAISDAKLNVKFKDLDSRILEKIQKTQNQREKEKLLLDLISKGLKIEAKLNIKNINYAKQTLGFVDFNGFVYFKPTNNLEEKIKSKNYDFVNFEIKLKTSPKIAALIMMFEPKMAIIFKDAKSGKNFVEVSIKKTGEKIYINGKEIKSN